MMKHLQYFNIVQISYLLCLIKLNYRFFPHDLSLIVHHASLGNLMQRNYQEIIAPVPNTLHCVNTANR